MELLNTSSRIPVWLLGGCPLGTIRTTPLLKEAILASGAYISPSAQKPFKKRLFYTDRKGGEILLVGISVNDIRFTPINNTKQLQRSLASASYVIDGVRYAIGNLCPSEVGPALCLHRRDLWVDTGNHFLIPSQQSRVQGGHWIVGNQGLYLCTEDNDRSIAKTKKSGQIVLRDYHMVFQLVPV